MQANKRKLFLIFHGRFPGEKAAAIFAAKSAEAFADSGFDVTVLSPRRLGRVRETPASYFGVKDNFGTVYLPIVDFFFIPFLKKFAFLKSYTTFSISVALYLFFKLTREDVVYSNEGLPLLLASYLSRRTYYEVHDFPTSSWVNRALVSRVSGIIATNRWKHDELIRRFGLPAQKVLYEPNAVDAFRFGNARGEGVRAQLPLEKGTVVLGYAGTLKTMGMEKGIRTLLEALSLLPARFRCLIVGGLREDIAGYAKVAEELHVSDRVTFTGWMHYDSVPEQLAACDILVAPFPKTSHYDLYMSPMKLFEYMAVGKPIVASRLRAIEEVVDDSTAYLVPPDSPKALAEGITYASSDSAAGEKVRRAREAVAAHTWRKRATRIIDFFQ